jgi:hypothetical protein
MAHTADYCITLISPTVLAKIDLCCHGDQYIRRSKRIVPNGRSRRGGDIPNIIPNFKKASSYTPHYHRCLPCRGRLTSATLPFAKHLLWWPQTTTTNGNNNNKNSKNNNNHPRTIRCIFLGHMRKSRTDRRCYFTHVAHMDIVTRTAVAIMRMVRIIMAMAVWDLQQAKQGKGMGNVLRIVIFPMDFVPVHLHVQQQINNDTLYRTSISILERREQMTRLTRRFLFGGTVLLNSLH